MIALGFATEVAKVTDHIKARWSEEEELERRVVKPARWELPTHSSAGLNKSELNDGIARLYFAESADSGNIPNTKLRGQPRKRRRSLSNIVVPVPTSTLIVVDFDKEEE